MAIENDKVVSIGYELKDVNTKEILDSNIQSGKPLEFIIGRGQIIPGLEDSIKELNAGDTKDIIVKAEDAYGKYNEKAQQTLPKEQFAGIELTEGMTLFGQGEDNQSVQVTVKSFTDDEVTVDFNHPLAGKDLLFAVNVIDVRDATENELATGVVGEANSCCGGGHCEDNHSSGKNECCSGEHSGDKNECCDKEHSGNNKKGGCCGSH